MASSYRSLLATVKTELVEAKRASQHRIELFHALETFLPDFQAFLELSFLTFRDFGNEMRKFITPRKDILEGESLNYSLPS